MKIISFIALSSLSFSIFAREMNPQRKTLPSPRKVEAKKEYRPHVGLLYGLLIPEGSWKNTDSLGFDVGFQPYIPFGLGLEFTHTNLKHENDSHFNRNDLLFKGSYHFGGEHKIIRHSFVGLGMGASINAESTEFVMAPLAGFDVPLSHKKGESYFLSELI